VLLLSLKHIRIRRLKQPFVIDALRRLAVLIPNQVIRQHSLLVLGRVGRPRRASVPGGVQKGSVRVVRLLTVR